MERVKFYTKEEIAKTLGISLKTLGHRIEKHDDEELKSLYKDSRMFSPSEFEYILEKLTHQIRRSKSK